jgi:hypothetical protein
MPDQAGATEIFSRKFSFQKISVFKKILALCFPNGYVFFWRLSG